MYHEFTPCAALAPLIDKICICQRHFQRKFKDATGYTPKV